MKQQINQQVPDYSEYNLEEERLNLRNYLDKNGLWIPENFYQNIRMGDVVEVYTNPPDVKQIYGNAQFKKLCSYSEEMMRTTPLTKLFWRSDEIQLKLVKRSTQVALNENEAVEWGIEKHELIENFHPAKRTFEMDHGWIAPCMRKGTNERYAWVTGLRVNLIFEWSNNK